MTIGFASFRGFIRNSKNLGLDKVSIVFNRGTKAMEPNEYVENTCKCIQKNLPVLLSLVIPVYS